MIDKYGDILAGVDAFNYIWKDLDTFILLHNLYSLKAVSNRFAIPSTDEDRISIQVTDTLTCYRIGYFDLAVAIRYTFYYHPYQRVIVLLHKKHLNLIIKFFLPVLRLMSSISLTHIALDTCGSGL